MYITNFNSKRFVPSKRIHELYKKRKEYLDILNEQDIKFEETFKNQSVRYSFHIQENWIEEKFESLDGNVLTFYHDIPSDDNFYNLVKEIIDFYGYIYGGQMNLENKDNNLEEIILEDLKRMKKVSYLQNTIVYEEGENEVYLFVRSSDNKNFIIKAVERNELNESKKDEIRESINKIFKKNIVNK